MIKKIKSFAAGLSVSFFAATSLFSAECIAPANPGGGWDFTCRTITKIMYDIGAYDSPIQVTNMAGGGGGLAYGHVVNERNTDDNLIVAASSATATRLAQNAYSGMTYADSPYKNLNDLLDAVIADPANHAFAGGSAAGGFDHLKVLMALGKKGFTDIAKVKYIGVDGDADAITQTVGGFTAAMTGDISGVVGFIKSGDVRVLASFTDERIPGFEDIPTAKEQGIDVVAVNWRGLYTPKGASDASYKKWTEALRKVGDSAEWKKAMEANGLAPFNKVGPNFQDYVVGVMAEVQAVSKERGVMK